MFELVIAVILIALNGLFSLSELAVVSARRTRLKTMAERGRPGAATALELADDPGRFLSTVQIGITLVGILAGAFSGAALGQRLSDLLLQAGLAHSFAEPMGFGLVIGVITYLSVVVGELVPKHLALKHAETIACLVAPLMAVVSRIGSPVVWLLDASTKGLFRLFGATTDTANAVTDEEIRSVVAEAETAGVIETHEKVMISGVLRLGDRPARAVMTPRTDVDWIRIDDADLDIRAALGRTTHSRLPVSEGDPDNMIGVIQVRELLAPLMKGEPLDLRSHVRAAPIVPDTQDALSLLDVLRAADVPMLLVHDEYGHFEGIVTPADILDAIAGAFRSDELAGEHSEATQREDGSWLLAGWMPADEMAELLNLDLPQNRDYQTVAGLVISNLRYMPRTGESVTALGWRFEVVDLDGRRIDKVLASRA